ncbi:hypothetical protein IMZ11_41425, partial [Microtetraspora sp. AC03309]|uniref:hypothetical protein n=1 Tax=Microtetraspora sp. AC03309 TaxID=2779376 RepID=UPI001E4D75F7
APAPAPEPVEVLADDDDQDQAEHHEYDADDDEQDAPEGIPAGHLVAGGATGGTVLLGMLYQLTGVPGLIAGSVLAGGGAVAYVRHRRGGGRTTSGSAWGTASASKSGGKNTTGSLFSGGKARKSAGSALFSTGRSGSKSRGSLLGKATAGRAGSKSSGAPTGAHRATGKAGTVRQQVAAAGRAVRKARREAVAAAKTTTGGAAAKTATGKVRKAATWVNDKTGGRAGRAGKATIRAAATGARKAAVWADRKTGRRVSSAYRAAATGKDTGFRARQRRAAAVLGWHGPVTGPVLALVAVLSEAWKRRKARKAAAEETETAESSEDAPKTAPAEEDPAITTRIICPRCMSVDTVTLPAGEAEIWVTCVCGHKTRVFRDDSVQDIPDHADEHLARETTQTTAEPGRARGRRPYTAPTTYTRRNRTMSANPLAAAAADLNAVAAAHAPVDMWQVARELDQLVEVPANVAMALRTYTSRLQGEYPIDPVVIDALGQLYAAHGQLVAMADEIGPLFRRIHAEDLKREEAPRVNEAAWNV